MKFIRSTLSLGNRRTAGATGVLLVLAVGFALLSFNSRLGKSLTRASYDSSFDLAGDRGGLAGSEVVMVYMDEASYRALDQPFNAPWDRALHARLLERLGAFGARAVVFDILFTDAGSAPAADGAFERSIREHGGVVLAADFAVASQSATDGEAAALSTFLPPHEPLQNAAAGWGLAQLQPDEDFIVRRHYHGPSGEAMPSLSWATGELLGLPVTKEPGGRQAERWVRYYGGPETIPYVSYARVMEEDGVRPEFFRDKVVVVGARPIAGSFIERRDELRSSFSSWNDRFLFMPAVEVHATVLLNLIRGDWLVRLPPVAEWAILLGVAMVFGYGLCHARPLVAAGLAIVGTLASVLAAQWLFTGRSLWFPWMIIVAAQIPTALLWSVLSKSVEWYVQKRRMEKERHEAEERIHEQAALLDKARDAIFVVDLEGRFTYWNRSAERLYGWRQDELAAAAKALLGGDGSAAARARTATLQAGEWNGELTHDTKSGGPVTVESRWTLVRDDRDAPKALLVINTDITEQKKLEAQFLRTQRMESIGTLAGGIAHDLNNVLAPILLGVELLEQAQPDDRTRKMLATIHTSAKRGQDMVKQVLSFARGQEGEKKPLQLQHLVREMDKIMRETFPKNIQTRLNLGKELWLVNGDSTQLHQVLLNLCVNARDAMPEGGEIHLELSNAVLDEATAKGFAGAQAGSYLLLRVTDTGTGIARDIIDKIFEPFFTTKEIGKGTGLGLSTLMTIIKNHGGCLDLKSELGRGTTFSIYLPADETAQLVETAAPDREALRGQGELILVADDEAAIRETLESALVAAGYRVLAVANGSEAFAAASARQGELRLVIMDMMMPVMPGHTAIRMIQRQIPAMKFLAVSGLAVSDKLKPLLAPNRVEFLAKPFNTDAVLTAIRVLLVPLNQAAA